MVSNFGDDEHSEDMDKDNIQEKNDAEEKDKEDETGDCYDFNDDRYKCSVFLNQDVLCSMQDKHAIGMNWVLPDIQSTTEVFSNE